MVDAIVSILFENLNTQIQNEFQLLGGVKKDMEKLRSIIQRIQVILPNGEAMAARNEELKDWLTKLSDAAYDADDILSDWAVEDQRLEVESTSGCGKIQVSKTFFPCFHFQRNTFRHKIGTRIKQILETFNSIAEERQKFNFEVTPMSSESEERTPTFSLVNEKEIYGRDEDKKKIVELLLADVSNENDVPVIAIVGMGGLGKTTLAQLAYNDENVKGHFELRMWVYVSQDFVVTRIVKAILESANGRPTVLTQLDEMQKSLREIICEKRFLLVLDDVWNENSKKWDDLKKILTCKGKGSKIVVTTRKETVALMMGALHESPHLTGLSDSDCWSLFENQAFEPGRSEEHPNLVTIGKEIVKKCGGVPLAAKALGSLLRLKRDEPLWSSVRDSQIWELQEDDILPALRLSYTNLPSHLRQCFSFCSVFPKGYRIVKEELILMWIANGFVTPKGRMELEDVGNEIFNDLLWRSFFQDIEKDYEGNISCKMHDLVHDLARSVIGNKCYIVDSEKTDNIPPSTRYVYSLLECPGLYKAKAIRTMLLGFEYKSGGMEPWILRDIEKFRYLRCLDLSMLDFNPHSICNLKQLRYLSLADTYNETLPESIIYLQNLQTLKLKNWLRLCNLPPLGQLPSLKNLEIGMPLVKQINKEFYGHSALNGFSFPSLKRLSLSNMYSLELWASVEKGGAFPCLNELKIEYCPKLITLPCFLHLTSLVINHLDEMSSFPENFLRHGNALQRLEIRDCDKLRSLPRELDNFIALKSLVILDCMELVSLPEGLRNLTSLEKLEVGGCGSLISLAEEGVLRGLKSLQSLVILGCKKLVSLPDDLRYLTALQNLEICYCDEFESLPDGLLRHLKSLQSLRISNSDKLVSLLDDSQYLIALQNLEINFCDKFESLPDGLQHVTTLQHLSIGYCPIMQNLPEWVEKLTSLRSLTIRGCGNMTSLPAGLQRLTSLQELCIHGCRNLTRRCERERGEDWHKIAHVPHITIE
ncbi:disease resistance protein RGA2-like [Tasmannia lanceolata]|uniref:disease resistance protein RGA2-like n=1 Tax=Tasmannia lanceolata TaxID=3420 RepID=UPI0040628587